MIADFGKSTALTKLRNDPRRAIVSVIKRLQIRVKLLEGEIAKQVKGLRNVEQRLSRKRKREAAL